MVTWSCSPRKSGSCDPPGSLPPGSRSYAACSRESLEGRVWGPSLVWDSYRSASETCLGVHLGLEVLAQAVAGAPRVWKAQERSGEAWTAPLSRSQVLGSGAKVRVRLSSSAWATAAALGAEVGRMRVALRVGVALDRRQWWGH